MYRCHRNNPTPLPARLEYSATGMPTLVLQLQHRRDLQHSQLAAALTPSLYTEMLKNPRVIGVKNSMPVQDIQNLVSLWGEDHIVFNGPDEQFEDASWMPKLPTVILNSSETQSVDCRERFGKQRMNVICYQRNHRQAHFCTWKYVRCDYGLEDQ